MTAGGARTRIWGRRVAVAALALVLLAVIAIHTPPFRRAVLQRVVATTADRFDIALRADTLAYNLLDRRVTLTGVSASSRQSPEEPFFAAARLDIIVSRSALFGAFRLDDLSLSDVSLNIVRHPDGTTNLPQPGADDGGEPGEVPIDRLRIDRLAFTLTDQADGIRVVLPAVAADVGREQGTLRLLQPGRVSRGAAMLTVQELGGGVAFDGRTVRLSDVALRTSDGWMEADGTVALLVDEPGLRLTLTGSGDVQQLARWGTDAAVPAGTIGFDGTVQGPLDALAIAGRARSDRLAWQQVIAADVDVSFAADADGIDVRETRARFAGGAIAGSGRIGLPNGDADLDVAWSDLDLNALTRMFSEAGATIRLAGTTTGTADLRGAGADLRGWTIDARARIDARPTADEVALPGDLALRVSSGRWQLNARHRFGAAPLRADLTGLLRGTRVGASTVDGMLALDETDLVELLDQLRLAGILDVEPGLVIAGRIAADTSIAGTLGSPRLAIAAVSREVVAAGIQGVAADIRAEGTPQQMSFAALVRSGADNTAASSGTLFITEGRVEGSLDARLTRPQLLLPTVPLGGVIDADLAFEGPFSALAARGSVTVDDATYGEFRLGRLLATLEANAQTVHADLSWPELSATARADVPLAGPRRVIVDVTAEGTDLARIVRDAALPVAVRGTLDLTARADIPFDDPRAASASVEVARLDAVAGELAIALSSPARATYSDRLVNVEQLDAELGGLRLSVAGLLPAEGHAGTVASADALRALLVGDVADAIAAVRAAGVDDVAGVSGRGLLALVASVTGSLERPQLSADVDLADGDVTLAGHPPVRGVAIRAHLAEGRVEPLHVSGEWQGARFVLDGRFPLRVAAEYLPEGAAAALPPGGGPATLTVRVESITPAVLEPYVDAASLEQIAGAVDASLRLEADALNVQSLRGDVSIDRLDVRVGGLPVAQREPTRVAIGDGVARVAAWDWTGQGATLGVQGQVRLVDGEAALSSAGRIDLRMLTPFVREAGMTLAGTLVPRVSIRGPLDSPQVEGEVTLEAAEIRLRDPRIVATGLAGAAVLSPAGARVTALSGVVNGGTLTGSGTAEYGAGRAASARLNVTIAGMGLELPEGLRSELDVDLTAALANAEEGAGGTISGTVTVLRSAYRETLAVVAGLLAAARSERLAATAAPVDSLASRVTLDIGVITENDIVVDNNIAQLALEGDLVVVGTAAAPSLAGRATVREGGQLFLGRNVYTIQSGTIDFIDPVTIQPELNIDATTRAGGYDIELALSGTPDNLEVDLSAPGAAEEPSEADIASLLLTGRTLDDIPGDERQIVGEQVLGYLSGDVLGLAGRVIGLDALRLGGPEGLRRDPVTIAAETDPTSRLTFGKSIGDNVELTYSQSLRESSAQTWIVDYEPLRQLNLRLVSDDDHLRTYEFRHDVSIGGGARTRTARPAVRERAVAAVTVNGGDAALRETLRLAPGDTFDFAEWQRDRDRLEQALHVAGRLEARVAARSQDTDAGIALVYDVAPGPQTVLAVEGDLVDEDTRQRLAEAWTQSVFDDFLEEEAVEIVTASLRDAGYLQPGVRAEMGGSDPKTLSVRVEAGVRAREWRLAIEAADEELAQEVEAFTRAANLTSWRTGGDVESAVTAEWRRRGYLRVLVESGMPRMEGPVAVLPVSISAGPRFTIGEVRVEGASRLEPDRILAAAGLPAGDPYDPVAIDEGRGRVEALYRAEGFAGARVAVAPPALDAPGAGTTAVAVVLRVDEGARQVLREVTITGQRGTSTDLITRALDLSPGEPLARDAWLEARARLFDTGLFRRVDVSAEPVEDGSPSAERPMRLRVGVEEWPALRLRYGFQVSEERPEGEIEGRDLTPGFSADVTRRTLFGRAISLGAAAEYQRRERSGRVFMNAPTLFGLPVESLLTLQRSRREFADATFLTDASSVSWEQRTRLGRHLQLSYAYRFERDHTFDTDVPEDPQFPVFDVTANVARLTGSAAFDTRDDPTDTRRGTLVSASVEIAPEALGSEFSFARQVNQAYHFRPWREVVFASAARFGLASPRGGQELLPSELFFVGGPRTIRGAVQDTVGPRDFLGEPAGGRALFVVNHETRFPLFRWFRGVAFVDAGNVFDGPGDISFRRFTTSIGAGLRVSTPFALLRADYARIVANEGEATPARWSFGIGHSF